jgi:hypothetical protein
MHIKIVAVGRSWRFRKARVITVPARYGETRVVSSSNATHTSVLVKENHELHQGRRNVFSYPV